ncbi:hypothetical protein KP509_1Z150900 [Ceratopteris richardii]|nr:hypothetical protein KP509_1Z150900 [Ceratopteris richardii]
MKLCVIRCFFHVVIGAAFMTILWWCVVDMVDVIIFAVSQTSSYSSYDSSSSLTLKRTCVHFPKLRCLEKLISDPLTGNLCRADSHLGPFLSARECRIINLGP